MEEVLNITRKYQKQFNKTKNNGNLNKKEFSRIIKSFKKDLNDKGLSLSDHQCIKVAYGNTDIIIDCFFNK